MRPRFSLRRASAHPVQLGWMALSLLGFAGGLLSDPTPARPIVRREGYRVLEADFHAHTTFSDGSLTPIGLVRQAERRGLDVIAITEHNTVAAGKIGRAYAQIFRRGGPIVIVGEEVTTARFHIIALGLESTVAASATPAEVIRDVHAQHGLAIAAHPVEPYWPALLPVRAELDGSEVMHPIAYSEPRSDWRWSDTVTFWEDAKPPLAAIGSSDYHFGSILGLCRTLVFVKEASFETDREAAVIEAIREGHTVTRALDGRTFGHPDMVRLLEREPYEPRSSDYRYHGEGWLDRILRTCGYLGLLGAFVFGRARRRGAPASVATAKAPAAE